MKIIIRNVLTGEVIEEIHCDENRTNDLTKEVEKISVNLDKSRFQIEIEKDDK